MATESDSVLLKREGGVAVVTLHRPQAKNAIDAPTTDALTAALRELRADAEVRAVVLTGAGGDFCAGGDVKGMGEGGPRTPEQRRAGMARYRELALALHGLDKPLVAAIDGVAFGAGLSMALYADLVLVSTRARMAMVFHRIGLVPDVGAWYTLPRALGLQRAKELIYSAREFGAEEAVRMGLALEAVEPDQLMPRALRLAESLAGASPTAFSLSKRALAATLQSDLETMLDMEASAQAIAGSSEYFREAIRRFAAKEPAQFRWPAKD
jgi:2-(1,2-epoxy-1,2-dihydrophenyl)acetyl-CoA isomerase